MVSSILAHVASWGGQLCGAEAIGDVQHIPRKGSSDSNGMGAGMAGSAPPPRRESAIPNRASLGVLAVRAAPFPCWT